MDVELNFKGGGSFVELCPQFCSNSEVIYVAWKNKILGYIAKTGLLCTEFIGISDRIVGFSVHIYDSFECITACSESGEIITWKAATKFKILNRKILLNKVKNFKITHQENDGFKALIGYRKSKKICFCLYNLHNDIKQSYKITIKHDLNSYFFDVSGDKYFAIAQNSTLFTVQFATPSLIYSHSINSDKFFTCIACHPNENVILTGDQTGRVIVWENIFAKKAVKAVFHWHTLPVLCVGFSTSGSRFYSGGKECVLVKWEMGTNLQKSFLPRLASHIRQVVVSPDNVYVAIATQDNAVSIIGPQNEEISVIQNLVIGNQVDVGIVVDTKSKVLIMNGTIGHVQFYSPNDRSLLYNVDIVCQNKLSHERGVALESTEVMKVAISNCGMWLATVEQRKDSIYFGEIRLKFWCFDQQIQNFKLNTSIEYPHENNIVQLLFRPSVNEDDLLCVTVGCDRRYKVWQLQDSSTIYRQGNSWSFLCIGFLKNLSCTSAAFTVDGSLLAVSFDQIITAWVPETCELKCSLVHPIYREKINQINFGIQKHCHLLVSASDNRLSVWNILTLTMIWTVPLKVSYLLADTITANMAVITRDQKLFVFSPDSPEVIYSNDEILKGQDIVAAGFVPSKFSNDGKMKWHQRSPIMFINQDRELFSIGSGDEIVESEFNAEDQFSLYSQMLPKLQTSTVAKNKPLHHVSTKDSTQKNIKKYLEAPIHTLIPIRIMCGSLLRSLVQKAQ